MVQLVLVVPSRQNLLEDLPLQDVLFLLVTLAVLEVLADCLVVQLDLGHQQDQLALGFLLCLEDLLDL